MTTKIEQLSKDQEKIRLINDLIASTVKTVHYPGNQSARKRESTKVKQILSLLLGRQPTDIEIEQATDIWLTISHNLLISTYATSPA